MVSVLLLILLGCCAAQNQFYGIWHCGNDGCDWNTTPNKTSMAWIMDRGDGKPTVNVFSMAFLNPQIILTKGVAGVPAGMTKEFINGLKARGITVLMSIGGITFVSDWEKALRDPVTLGHNAAAIAQEYGVGIEIDYEGESHPAIANLSTFIKDFLPQFIATYRGHIPVDNSTTPHTSSVLTVDVDASDRWLQELDAASAKWVEAGEISWINAMVSNRPYHSAGDATDNWQVKIDGDSRTGCPPVKAGNLCVSMFAGDANIKPTGSCKKYAGSVLEGVMPWVKKKKVKGLMFWGPGNMENVSCPGIQSGSKAFLG